jgi:hypothetical protein
VHFGYGSLLTVFRVGKFSQAWGLNHFQQCSNMGNAVPREIWILACSIQTREISSCGVGIPAGNVQTREISAYGVGLLLAVLRGTRSSVRSKDLGWG